MVYREQARDFLTPFQRTTLLHGTDSGAGNVVAVKIKDDFDKIKLNTMQIWAGYSLKTVPGSDLAVMYDGKQIAWSSLSNRHYLYHMEAGYPVTFTINAYPEPNYKLSFRTVAEAVDFCIAQHAAGLQQ